jgi:hypothetical protein
MICPRCGTENGDASKFCHNCALPLKTAEPVYKPPPVYQRRALDGGDKIIIIAIVIIALLGIAALAGSFGSFMSQYKADNNSSTNTSSGSVALDASSVRPYLSGNLYMQPTDGDQFVMVNLNLTNHLSSSTDLNPFYFTMTGSDGLVYDHTWKVSDSMASQVTSGSTAPISICFEIPAGVTPSTLTFTNGLFDRPSITLTGVWSSVPVQQPSQIVLKGASYSAANSGNIYYMPDPGDQFINITVTVTNARNSSVTLNPYSFTIDGSDGSTYSKYVLLDDTVPDGLQAGASAKITIGYMIPTGTFPRSLEYQDGTNWVKVNFP